MLTRTRIVRFICYHSILSTRNCIFRGVYRVITFELKENGMLYYLFQLCRKQKVRMGRNAKMSLILTDSEKKLCRHVAYKAMNWKIPL